MIQKYFSISEKLQEVDKEVRQEIQPRFEEIEKVKEENQLKMLRAFMDCRVAANHLAGTTGYGYGDAGRDKLEEVFAQLTGSEAALLRHQFMSGTHALTVALFGVLRPGDTMLCATGRPYDTLIGVLGIDGNKGEGSLAEFGISYAQTELKDGRPDLEAIRAKASQNRILYLQRSRGYANRPAMTLEDIRMASEAAKQVNPDIDVIVDNCYGEFTQIKEPTQCGADLIIGSLIKNPGGGIAPTGGYIAGRADLVRKCAARFTAPGVGAEVGCTGEVLRQMYLGLYFAPGVTAEALKTCVYASALFQHLGYAAKPGMQDTLNDIIASVEMQTPGGLRAVCEGIQFASPIDSYVTPEPWPMPGYDDNVIMAAGAFTAGSSIELSCDGPMRAPYTAFMQGGLNFAASRAAVLQAAQRVLDCRE